MTKKQNQNLARARAYYRVAAKKERAGEYAAATRYREVADRFVRKAQADKAFSERLKAQQAAAQAKWKKI